MHFTKPLNYHLLLLYCYQAINSVLSSSVTNLAPVLWVPSKTRVSIGYADVTYAMHLASMCDLLDSTRIHTDLTDHAKDICNQLYRTKFLDPLKKVCPQPTDDPIPEANNNYDSRSSKIRKKRELITIICIIIAVTAATVAVPALVVGSTSLYRVDRLVAEQTETNEYIHKELNSIRKLLNESIDTFQTFYEDYSELKRKSIASMFTISSISSRMERANQAIQSLTRDWKKGEMNNDLFEFLDIAMPCGDECPVEHAIPKGCSMSADEKRLSLRFYNPQLSKDLEMFEADPFKLMHRTENETCDITYQGPKYIIRNKTSDCYFLPGQESFTRRGPVIATTTDCVAEFNFTEFFTINNCRPQKEGDEKEYATVKLEKGNFHVYCYGSNITMGGTTWDCGKDVFMIPMKNFTIGTRNYYGDQMTLMHRETHVAPSIPINLKLGVQLNFTSLKGKNVAAPTPPPLSKGGFGLNFWEHYMLVAGLIGCFVIMMLFFFICLFALVFKKLNVIEQKL